MTDALQPARLEISEAVSEMKRLGWPPASEYESRISGQTKKRNGAAALEISKGAPTGEQSLAVFGGVVFQGEAKAGKSLRRGGTFVPLLFW